MCGIYGFTKVDKGRREAKEYLGRMRDLLRHRGPDSDGQYVDEAVALGHNRLSIIDLSTGAQPMKDWKNRYVITYNGEVYNFPELRNQFEKQGFRFRTRSDTEVILAAYHFYQEACVKYLQGMFAFAIWDRQAERLFLGRDRLGQKPLYYFHDDKHFVFASEIKAILALPGVPREIDNQAIDFYLTHGYIPAPWSAFRHIRKVREAHYLVFEANRMVEKQYWWLPEPETSPTKSEHRYGEELEDILEDAVRSRLISEVPLGAFLSGGVDSSAIVAMMAKCNGRTSKTFTIDFAEKTFSELKDAQRVAAHCKTDHRVLQVSMAGLVDLVPKLVWQFDEPFADSSAIPTYYVSKMAREHVTVILSGDGGDELFAGYNNYHKMNQYRTLLRLPQRIRHILLDRLAGSMPVGAPARNFLKYVAHASAQDGPDALGIYPFIKDDVLARDFRNELGQHDPATPRSEILAKLATSDKLSRLQYLDTLLYLPGDILVKVDRMSMTNSLETRAPLLDYRLVEFAARLPVEFKMRNGEGKYLLKKILRKYIPEENLVKPKQGFAVPIKHWFRTKLYDFCKEILLEEPCKTRGIFDQKTVSRVLELHNAGRRDYSAWIWSMLNLELWFQTYLDASTRRI